MNNRRKLVIALGACALTAPFGAFAQKPAKIPRIGFLVFNELGGRGTLFQQGLFELGYVEGRNIHVEYRSAESKEDRLAMLAVELVSLNLDVFVALDPPSYRAAIKATKTIPIVIRASTDPVAEGIAASLAHPRGNVTGVFSLYSELIGKRMELLKETVPKVSRLLVLWDPQYADAKEQLGSAESAARAYGLRPLSAAVHSDSDFDSAFKSATRERANALLVLRTPLMVRNRARIAGLAAKARLPAVYDDVAYAQAGGLMSYGASLNEMYRHSATYVDKILKGAKPGDLPIEQPTKFELVINMKTAKVLGIKIPDSILLRADKVIE